jgi:hypothetical protein
MPLESYRYTHATCRKYGSKFITHWRNTCGARFAVKISMHLVLVDKKTRNFAASSARVTRLGRKVPLGSTWLQAQFTWEPLGVVFFITFKNFPVAPEVGHSAITSSWKKRLNSPELFYLT